MLVLVLLLSAAVLVLERTVMNEPIFDHEKLDVYRLSIDYVAYSYPIAKDCGDARKTGREKRIGFRESIDLFGRIRARAPPG